ncbi:hypothetical protein [Haloferax sp. DFSO52]|uniref:DUF7546 family protein n=1 Tax=Haloferax sp. DFSO52 TaxID=3388505 RepID=UPI003A8BC4B7
MSTQYAPLTDTLRVPVVRWLLILSVAEAAALAVYLLFTPVHVDSLRYVLYPFIWINVGIAAVLVTTPSTPSRRLRLFAGVIAVAYFLVLATLAGLISVNVSALVGSGGHMHAAGGHPTGFQFSLAAPGWGPRLGYASDAFSVVFIPYRVIGFLALSYLIYAALVETARTALSGTLGVISCVGCTFSLAAGFSAGLAGGTGFLSALRVLSVDFSTVVFVAAVVLLVYRPSADGVAES